MTKINNASVNDRTKPNIIINMCMLRVMQKGKQTSSTREQTSTRGGLTAHVWYDTIEEFNVDSKAEYSA